MNINVQPPGTVADAYGPTWYAGTRVAAAARPRLTIDTDVDVCIIGGGLAGLTAAREIALRGWSVALLETKRIAWNASGRNCGFVLPGFGLTAEKIIERVGLDDARALWKLSEEGAEYVRKTIRGDKMRGVDPVPGWLHVSKLDAAEEIARRADLLADKFDANVDTWPTGEVRAVLRSASYFQALHYPRAFAIHPLNYALRLAEAAEAAGARIYEDTPALSIDPAGIRKRVITPLARVRAAHVVLAGSVHLGRVAQRLHETLLPIWSYVVVTDRIGPALADAITYRGGISDGDRADNHYRIVDGERLLWSGRVTTWEANPRWFMAGLRGDIRRAYPQLRRVRISHAWSGVLGRTVHSMPQVGELSPGLWVASGFGGHGINTTAMAGNMIANGIVDRDPSWRLLAPFELIWAGRMLGRVAAQVFYWGHRGRERFAARATRVREVLLPLRLAPDGAGMVPEPLPPVLEEEPVPTAGPDEQSSVNSPRARSGVGKKRGVKAAEAKANGGNRPTNGRKRKPVAGSDTLPADGGREGGTG